MKKRNWKMYGAVVATLFVSGGVLAQQELSMVARTLLGQQEVMITGQTQTSPPETRTVKVDDNGLLLTSTSASTPTGAASGTHGACTNTTQTIGTSSVNCPLVPRADRASLFIQLAQLGETLTVTSDGTTAASATAGAAVASGGAYSDNLAGTVNTKCRCTAASCQLNIVECP